MTDYVKRFNGAHWSEKQGDQRLQVSPALAANSDSSSSRRRGDGSEARRRGTDSEERRSSRIWAVRLRIPCLSNRCRRDRTDNASNSAALVWFPAVLRKASST